MIFGPLSEFDISILKEKLDQFKVDYKVAVSDEHLAANRQDHLERDGSLPMRTYQPTQPYLVIDIPDSMVHYVEAELEKMGAIPPAEISEELEHEEFLCPKCDYISSVSGVCPKHGVTLVDYSEWVKGSSSSSSMGMIGFLVVIAVILGLVKALSAFFS